MISIGKSIVVLALAVLLSTSGCKTASDQRNKPDTQDRVDYHTCLMDFDTAMVANPGSPLRIGSEGWKRFEAREFLQALEEANDQVSRTHSGAAYRCRGMIKLHLKDLPGALEDFNQTVKVDPDSEWSYGGRAVTYLLGGNPILAFADCMIAVSMSPTNATLLGLRGYVNLKNSADALQDANKALQLNTNVGLAYSTRSQLACSRKAWDEALLNCNQAIRCKVPEYALRGWILANQNRIQEAMPDLNRAIERGDRDLVAYQTRAWCQLRLGNLNDATGDVDQAIRRAPKEPDNYNMRAQIETAKGDWDAARIDVDRAIELDPRNVYAWRQRVEMKIHWQDWTGALDACHRAAELSSEGPDLEFSMRGAILAGQKDFTAAMAELDRAIAAKTNDPVYYAVRGDYKWMNRDREGALADLGRAIELSAQFDGAYADRGIVKSELGYWDGGKEDLDRAITLSPSNRRYYVIRGRIKYHLGDMKGALADTSRAIELDRSNPDAWFFSSELKARMKDTAGSIADLDQTLVCRIDDPDQKAAVYNKRAEQHRLMRNEKLAVADYTRAIELSPRFADAFLGRAEAEYDQENWDAAVNDCNRHLSLTITARGLLDRAMNLRQLDRFQEALVDCDRAIALNPKSPIGYYQSALVRRAMGDLKGALNDLDQCVQLDPRPNYLLIRASVYFDLGNAVNADADLVRGFRTSSSPNALAIRASFKEVRSDYEGALVDWKAAMDGWGESKSSMFASCRIWLLKMRLKRNAEAEDDLRKDLAKPHHIDESEWPMAIARYLLGDFSETRLFDLIKSKNKAGERGKLCEFYYYTGMKHLFDGDKEAARSRFQKSVDTKMYGWFEYRAAQNERRLVNEKGQN